MVGVACCVGAATAGGAVAAQFVVPAEVHLPVGDALSEYGLKVRWYESLRRNARQTVGITEDRVAGAPVVYLRYYPPREGVDLRERFDLNRFAGPGQWFERACTPESSPATVGDIGAASTEEEGVLGRVDLTFGPVEQTELRVAVDYVKRCPQQPDSDRHGRLLMMQAPGGDGVVMLDADLEGVGTGQGTSQDLRKRLHDVAERVRKLD